jgi:hypothetical protein
MMMKMFRRSALIVTLAAAAVLFAIPARVEAQGRGGGAPARSAKDAAPIDLTGYWVALITEDWRYRMMVPAPGDHPSVPLNAEGRKFADAWDPAKDEAAGNQCLPYGAGGVTRMAGRLHITWQDDATLKVEADTGTQTRLLHFGAPPQSEEGTLQGAERANWEFAGGRGPQPGQKATGGDLNVVITKAKAAYSQRNGVPYSANATITEHYDVVKEANGDEYLIVTTLIVDPTYLARPWQRSTHFRKQANANGWDPTPCALR